MRFVALVGLGWSAARVALLWQDTGSLPEAIRVFVPVPSAIAAVDPVAMDAVHADAGSTVRMTIPPPARVATPRPPDPIPTQFARVPLSQLTAPPAVDPAPASGVASVIAAAATIDPVPRSVSPVGPLPALAGRSRLSVSSWLIARNGRGIGVSPGSPQLGGSQGGFASITASATTWR